MDTLRPAVHDDAIDAIVDAIPAAAVTSSTGPSGLCIEFASIITRALRRVGIASRPLPCALLAANAEALELRRRGIPVSSWPPSAWSVGCDPAVPAGGRGVDYHVVVIGAEPANPDRWFWLDVTAPQFSRPGRGIDVPGAIVARDLALPDDPFDRSLPDGAHGLSVDLADGATVEYRFIPRIKAFRSSGAWREDNRRWVESLATVAGEHV